MTASVKNLSPPRTSILTPNASVTPRETGLVGSKETAFSNELHPVPPLHLDAQEITPQNLQKQVMDAYETLRRATLPMRQNPASAPCHSRGIVTTASPSAPQIIQIPHALGRPYTGAHVSRHQGTQFQGHETVPGSVAYIAVTNGGTGYSTPPQVVVSGGGGTGVQAEAVVANGAVSYVKLINAGTGHSSVPSVSFVSTPTTGSGSLTATGATAAGSNVAVTSTTVTSPSGTGAVAAATLPPAYDPSRFIQMVAMSAGSYDVHAWGD